MQKNPYAEPIGAVPAEQLASELAAIRAMMDGRVTGVVHLNVSGVPIVGVPIDDIIEADLRSMLAEFNSSL